MNQVYYNTHNQILEYNNADWDNLRFTGTLNTSVDGETIRLSDISGSTSNKNHKTNFAFPTEVTKSA